MKAKILELLRRNGDYVSGQELCKILNVSRTAVWKSIRSLESEGYRIEAVRNKGYRLIEESAADAEKAVEYYREYYRPTGIFECSLYDGITDAFELIKKEGVAVALATAKPDIFAERIAKKFGFDKYLSFLSGAALDGSRDDKADIIARALQNLPGVTPENAVMVGDRSYDVESGKKLGLYTVGALYGYGSRQELSSADALAGNAYQTAELALTLLGKIKN